MRVLGCHKDNPIELRTRIANSALLSQDKYYYIKLLYPLEDQEGITIYVGNLPYSCQKGL